MFNQHHIHVLFSNRAPQINKKTLNMVNSQKISENTTHIFIKLRQDLHDCK